MSRLSALPGRVIRFALGLVAMLAGLLMAAVLVIGGVAVALCVYGIARMRGRRPAGLHFAWRGPLGAASHARRARAPHPAPGLPAEVVDVEVREIDPAASSESRQLGGR